MSSDLLAPVAYLAVEFPEGRIVGDELSIIETLVRNGTIAVLDLEFIAKRADGTVTAVPLEAIDRGGEVDVTAWRGSNSGLLDQADVDAVAAVLSPGSVAGIVVYENIWATELLRSIDAAGARLIGSGSVDAADLAAALDADHDR